MRSREELAATDNPPTAEEVLDICCNLMVHDETVDVFRVAQLSVREYFEKRAEYGGFELHSRAFGTCFDTLLTMPSSCFRMILSYRYASACWAFHCDELGKRRPEGVTRDKINEFLYKQQRFFDWASNLHYSSSGFQEIKVLMLEDARVVSSAAVSPLFAACVFGFLWILQDLDERLDFVWNFESDNGDTGLLLASKWGQIDVMRFLINKSVNVAATLNLMSFDTPLYLAIKNRQLESVLVLLKNGALTEGECWGMTTVEHAMNSEHTGILDAILNHSQTALEEWGVLDSQIKEQDAAATAAARVQALRDARI